MPSKPGANGFKAVPLKQTVISPAKINLCLHLLGTRPDGYHNLDSLVSFAEFGDRLTFDLQPASEMNIETIFSGPFADQVSQDDNSILSAVRALCTALRPPLTGNLSGQIQILKQIPPQAGLGGGSSNAATVLNTLNAHLTHPLDEEALADLGSNIGSDIAVCVRQGCQQQEPSKNFVLWRMTGRGETVTPVDIKSEKSAHQPWLVLIKPTMGLSTATVYRCLESQGFSGTIAPEERFSDPLSEQEVLTLLAETGNDLEPAARALCPEIHQIIRWLSRQPGCRFARLSGSGSACFGFFEEGEAANAALQELENKEEWWSVSTPLLGSRAAVVPGQE